MAATSMATRPAVRAINVGVIRLKQGDEGRDHGHAEHEITAIIGPAGRARAPCVAA